MKKNVWTALTAVALCFLLVVPTALGDTREGVIYLEGQEEKIEESLFISPLGFSFWYENEGLEAYHGEINGIEGVIVSAAYSDDYMVLSMITEEAAKEYTDDLDMDLAAMSAEARVQTEVYLDLDDGVYYFCTLIAENGQYLRAVGQYYADAAEGNAKFFQRVLDSVIFSTELPEADETV